MELLHSGLPIFYNEVTKEIEFRDGLTCEGSSKKTAGQMTDLLKDSTNIKEEEKMYSAYRNILFPQHEKILKQYDIRYDITVIEPGTVSGEYKKTSGHYHGYIDNDVYPYAEVYEVIKGEIIFILQKALNFDQKEEPVIEKIRVIHAKAGQSVIIPPFYGHCSINPTAEVSMFSNLAVVSCPLHYEPIQNKHGLSVYVMKAGESFLVVPNNNYRQAPEAKIMEPVEKKELGIEFGVPCYRNFIQHPEKYDFLLYPGPYVETIEKMYQ